MRRGEVWTQSGGTGYASKPRPVLIVQSDQLRDTESVIMCLFTSHEGVAADYRLGFAPTLENGLREESDLMVDKVMTVPRTKLGGKIGALSEAEMEQVEMAMLFVLGFAG